VNARRPTVAALHRH